LESASPPVSVGEIQKILQNLVKEGVSIRNMITILETFANNLQTRNPDILTEQVRKSLARQIVMDYSDENKELSVITIQAELERILRSGLSARDTGGKVIAMSPNRQNEIRDALTSAVEMSLQDGRFPVFLTTSDLRLAIFTLLERLFNTNKFAVLSHDEIPSEIRVVQAGEAKIEKQEEEQPVEF
jgi:flagellar biosynthesis protein FlhA